MTTIEIRVQPGARTGEIADVRDGVVFARVKSLPRKGEANRELIELMSDALKVSRGWIRVIRGHASRRKIIAVDNLSEMELQARLHRAMTKGNS